MDEFFASITFIKLDDYTSALFGHSPTVAVDCLRHIASWVYSNFITFSK